jgi:hypothetical protein
MAVELEATTSTSRGVFVASRLTLISN